MSLRAEAVEEPRIGEAESCPAYLTRPPSKSPPYRVEECRFDKVQRKIECAVRLDAICNATVMGTSRTPEARRRSTPALTPEALIRQISSVLTGAEKCQEMEPTIE
jgi:hypothetical protein